MFYYLYRMTHPETKEFYIGRRTSKLSPELDINYRGSSQTWYKKLDSFTIKHVLIKEIIDYNISSKEELGILEGEEILKYIKDPLCKNCHVPGKGFYFDNSGMKYSEESKIKMSISKKGKKMSEEQKEKLRKPKTEEQKEKMKGPRYNYRVPKEKIKCPHCDIKGAPNVMKRFHFDNCGKDNSDKVVKCTYCNKTGGISTMKRWHFDNCKSKQ